MHGSCVLGCLAGRPNTMQSAVDVLGEPDLSPRRAAFPALYTVPKMHYGIVITLIPR